LHALAALAKALHDLGHSINKFVLIDGTVTICVQGIKYFFRPLGGLRGTLGCDG
jgi:hypothetical protein